MFFKPLEKLKSPFWSCYCVFRDVLTTAVKDPSSCGLGWNVFCEIPGLEMTGFVDSFREACAFKILRSLWSGEEGLRRDTLSIS